MVTATIRTDAVPFGWVEVSDAALQRLRRELEQKGQGVVDEMGVLAIHAGYADYFFPGTSVLQTRPRYIFFTGWNLLWLAGRPGTTVSNVLRRKDDAELWVTSRLVGANRPASTSGDAKKIEGIIGVRTYREQPPRVPSQRVDFIYWTVLRSWGFYRSQEARDRGRLFRRWKARSIARTGTGVDQSADDVVVDDPLATVNIPPIPTGWQSEDIQELEFDLTGAEARLLQERLMGLPGVAEGACLIAKAAELAVSRGPIEGTKNDSALRPWDDPLLQDAARLTNQTERLERARRASSLAHYVRCTYAALVEWVVERSASPSRLNPQRSYRSMLSDLTGRAEMLRSATDLDLQQLHLDVPRLPELLRKCLSHVRDGLLRVAAGEDAEGVFMNHETHRIFEVVERRRKGARARLPFTEQGAGRRIGFAHDTIGVYDLDYRWRVIRDLLSDLHRGLARQ